MQNVQLGRFVSLGERILIDLYIPRTEQGAAKGTQGFGCRTYFLNTGATTSPTPMKNRPPAYHDVWGDAAKDLRTAIKARCESGEITELLSHTQEEEEKPKAAAAGKR